MTVLDPRTAMMEAEMKAIGRKARKMRKAITLDDFDQEKRNSPGKGDPYHMSYNPANAEQARRLMPTHKRAILGINPYDPYK